MLGHQRHELGFGIGRRARLHIGGHQFAHRTLKRLSALSRDRLDEIPFGGDTFDLPP